MHKKETRSEQAAETLKLFSFFLHCPSSTSPLPCSAPAPGGSGSAAGAASWGFTTHRRLPAASRHGQCPPPSGPGCGQHRPASWWGRRRVTCPSRGRGRGLRAVGGERHEVRSTKIQLAPFQDRSPFHSTHRHHRRIGGPGRDEHAIDRDKLWFLVGNRRQKHISFRKRKRAPVLPSRTILLTRPSPRRPGRAPPWRMSPPQAGVRAAPSHPLVWVGA